MNYWFRAKKYGYGWTPASWQGWFVLALYIFLSVHAFIVIDAHNHSGSDTLINFVPRLVVYTLILLLITYTTGEKPRWRWGK